ncbi:phosphotransferase family protein [Sphingobium sp. HWE2-09]|uniref:phosphotransferase family protein n=1 Tax=Sphingobium sp. HWE2-09 TaxID=3108390 RepID=UPI002DC8173B|nr:phosphotransferase family protein [Sphingobium sp. HWE2-09]
MTGSGEASTAGTSSPLDDVRLIAWMTANIDGYEGPLTISRFAGGQSNPTYRLSTPGRDYVLRRKPSGLLAPGAHAVDREARVMRALGQQGFPVPHIHALCTDEAVIGGWFYVMDYIEGRVFWDARFESVPEAERPAYFDAMNDTIARLHRFDPAALGLCDFGKAGNYFQRQISRWSRQYAADADVAGRDDAMDALIEWLPGHMPTSDETRLIHGDYRADNMVFHPTEPRVLAVLDWELSTLGHPLADFVNHAMMYHLPPTILSGLEGSDLHALNLPGEDAYVAQYCARTGRTAIDDMDWLLAFSLFRLAAIYHGIRARALRGNASSAHALDLAAAYPMLAARALAHARSGASPP